MPETGRDPGPVKVQAQDPVIPAAHGNVLVDVIQLFGEPVFQEIRARPRRVGDDRALDGPATEVDELCLGEFRADDSLVQAALDGVVVADDGAVGDGLGQHLDHHQGLLLGVIDFLFKFMRGEGGDGGGQKHKQGDPVIQHHPGNQGCRQVPGKQAIHGWPDRDQRSAAGALWKNLR